MKILENIKNHIEENKAIKEDYLYDKAKLTMINDLVDEYRHDNKNVYTVMRDITNVIKGW